MWVYVAKVCVCNSSMCAAKVCVYGSSVCGSSVRGPSMCVGQVCVWVKYMCGPSEIRIRGSLTFSSFRKSILFAIFFNRSLACQL